MTGTVYLLPTYLDPDRIDHVPEPTRSRSLALRHLVVENVRTTRRYLRQLDRAADIDGTTFLEWDKHGANDPAVFLQPALEGHDLGILSEAGCPGVADPGQAIVAEAHRLGLRVVPMTGPSSIFLALMASGMNGQQFRFHGYLPLEEHQRNRHLQHMEKDARASGETQIFMETPYRNNRMAASLVKILQKDTRLCIAANITGEREFIRTRTIREWRGQLPDLHKQPVIFLIL